MGSRVPCFIVRGCFAYISGWLAWVGGWVYCGGNDEGGKIMGTEAARVWVRDPPGKGSQGGGMGRGGVTRTKEESGARNDKTTGQVHKNGIEKYSSLTTTISVRLSE